MFLKIDTREKDLQDKINYFISAHPLFKDIKIMVECLPLGDIIIMHPVKNHEILIIERKNINDLLSSIKDGRYEEQSYRLNGNILHNHNIIYLIEGDINKSKLTSNSFTKEKQMLYSAIFSLNYYKGFSVIRTFSLDESAMFICNCVIKLINGEKKQRKGFYNNSSSTITDSLIIKSELNMFNESNILNQNHDQNVGIDFLSDNNNLLDNNSLDINNTLNINNTLDNNLSDKEYISLVKKVKKENITEHNIDEILLCQIPGISSITAIALVNHFGSLLKIMDAFKENKDCWKEVSYINEKKQTRKISKTIGANICKYLLKKND